MDGRTIERILKQNIKNSIIEIIAIDHLQRLLICGCFHSYPKGTILVVNSQTSFEKGKHWMLIYFGEKTFFIDSLCKNPKLYGIGELDGQVEVLKYKLQGDHSTVCGLYVVFFAILLSRGCVLDEIVARFSPDTCANDLLVLSWMKQCHK